MTITISDIARMAKVSKATVSAVLNDRPGISRETRDRVLEIVKRMNYRPNQVARSLSNRETKSIGLIIKEIDNPYFTKIMKGVVDTCSENGYTVLLGSSELSPEKEIESVETLQHQRVDGLIISPLQGLNFDFTYLAELIRDRYPLVMLEDVQNFHTNVVDIESRDAARKAVGHLIELGHEHIIYFAGPEMSYHNRQRLDGFRQAMIDGQLPIHQETVVSAGSTIEGGYSAGKHAFSSPDNRPTAVFCFNDLVAIGLMNALRGMEISVPEDVSVIGFDDNPFCEQVRIPLTTVHVPAFEIGVKAAELIIEQIQQKDSPLQRKVTIETKLIQRESTIKKQ